MSETLARKILTQPKEAFYPEEAIQLFTRYTRGSFFTQFVTQAKAYDPKKRIKRWGETRLQGQGTVRYSIIEGGKMQTMEMSGDEAAEINLPGMYSWPKHSPASTPAMMSGPFGFQGGVPTITLSTLPDAKAVAAALVQAAIKSNLNGFDAEVYEQAVDPAFTISWDTERRRQWQIAARLGDGSAVRFTVGVLLAQRHAKGEGSPGFWSVMPNSLAPLWTSSVEESGEFDARPEIPMPVRELLPNEVLKAVAAGPFGMGRVMVVNTEIESVYNPKPVVGTGGGNGGRTERLAEEIVRKLGGDPSAIK